MDDEEGNQRNEFRETANSKPMISLRDSRQTTSDRVIMDIKINKLEHETGAPQADHRDNTANNKSNCKVDDTNSNTGAGAILQTSPFTQGQL